MSNEKFEEKVRDSSFLIIVHEHTIGGSAHILRDFLLEKKPKNLLFIAHPLLYIEESYKKSSYFEYYKQSLRDLSLKQSLKFSLRSNYKDGKEIKRQTAKHWRLPEQLLYIKDFLYTLIWTFKTGQKYDVIVALDPLNAVAGIVLRTLGRAQKVAHYSIDYFPTRFQNPLMNKIYHQIDKFAVRFSDETWNVGGRMAKARAEFNNMNSAEYKKRQFHFPIGVRFNKIKRKPIEKFNQNELLYAGGFIDYMGIDMIIRALPTILKKIPNCTLMLIGRGDEAEKWKAQAKELKVEKHIKYSDWMENREVFHLRLSSAAIGLATFNYHILDDKVKNADPGKIKDYTSSGLPVITTKAIYTWKDIEKYKCGVVIDYNEKAFANAVIKLLTNKKLLIEYRKNALNYASQFDWDKLFTENLVRILK